MKKTFEKTILSVLIILLTGFFASCGYEPVFYGIMHDVAPEEATVNGNITNIARCTVGTGENAKEYLFVTGNGALKYKPASSSAHGEWKTYSGLPFELHYYNYFPTSGKPEGHRGQVIFRVVADKDNIYLLTANVKTDSQYGIVLPSQFYLWTKPLSDFFESKTAWKNIAEGAEKTLFPTKYNGSNGELELNFDVFSTNSPIPAHRNAYLRVINTTSSETTFEYYPLNGQSSIPPVKDAGIGTTNYIATDEKKKNTRVNSAFYLGDTLYFTDSFAVTTNESASKKADYACLSGTGNSYYSNNILYIYDGTELKELLKTGSTIASLAKTGNSILIGKGDYSSSYTTNGGIERILLGEDGKPENKTSAFDSSNNAKYQFTSSYILMTLLCADPDINEADASLYASVSFRGSGASTSANPKNIGLWSYYPGRGNWNRE